MYIFATRLHVQHAPRARARARELEQPHHVRRSIDLIPRHGERRPETNTVGATGEHDHPSFPQRGDQRVPLRGSRHAERAHQATATRIDDEPGKLVGQIMQAAKEIPAQLGDAG